MTKVERNYTIPLRKGFVKVPKYYRSKRAINQIKDFVVKHMKVEEVKLGKNLNEFIWHHGIKNPPGKVKVKITKNDSVATVELEGFDYKIDKIQTEKTDAPTSFKDKLASKLKMPEKQTEDVEEVSEPKEKPTKVSTKSVSTEDSEKKIVKKAKVEESKN
ncbi:hypothetical protein COV13_00670 [Candidatus Woesearchaeota archaeon CG10_big_fil_rev_8_21_14_0_10_32_9]|nr:MAG: hypothetical protein COV13_00670 [Candidatus Woesearchaeota archaeon CG10_big_fil_rev_8_21_14_0_10_32_9]